MSRSWKAYTCCLLLFCFFGEALLSGQRPSGPDECFSVHVHLNGKLLDVPQVVTVKTKAGESTLPLQGNCFNVPPSVLNEKQADVFLNVPGNRIQLFSVPTGFFSGPWDVALEDKKFARTVGFPKHARVREGCYVVFHGGEPENAVVQTNCRKPIQPQEGH